MLCTHNTTTCATTQSGTVLWSSGRVLQTHNCKVTGSGSFRPGLGGTGPHFCSTPQFRGSPWLFAKITQISDFFAFPNFRKMGKFVGSIERPKIKSASASEPSDQGLCSWTPLGTPLPDPYFRLTLPRSPWGRAPPQILGARTTTGHRFNAPITIHVVNLLCAQLPDSQSLDGK